MWECQKCHERHEDSFAVCWNCGTSADGVEDPNFESASEKDSASEAVAAGEPRRKKRGRRRDEAPRAIDQLIFLGLNGYALALDRDTGAIVWSNNELRSGYVSLLLDGDRLIVSTNGYTFCLDPLTGETLWHNPLPGYGVGPTALLSVRGQG